MHLLPWPAGRYEVAEKFQRIKRKWVAISRMSFPFHFCLWSVLLVTTVCRIRVLFLWMSECRPPCVARPWYQGAKLTSVHFLLSCFSYVVDRSVLLQYVSMPPVLKIPYLPYSLNFFLFFQLFHLPAGNEQISTDTCLQLILFLLLGFILSPSALVYWYKRISLLLQDAKPLITVTLPWKQRHSGSLKFHRTIR